MAYTNDGDGVIFPPGDEGLSDNAHIIPGSSPGDRVFDDAVANDGTTTFGSLVLREGSHYEVAAAATANATGDSHIEIELPLGSTKYVHPVSGGVHRFRTLMGQNSIRVTARGAAMRMSIRRLT